MSGVFAKNQQAGIDTQIVKQVTTPPPITRFGKGKQEEDLGQSQS